MDGRSKLVFSYDGHNLACGRVICLGSGSRRLVKKSKLVLEDCSECLFLSKKTLLGKNNYSDKKCNLTGTSQGLHE